MRILFVGNLRDHSRARQRADALRRLGHQVVDVPTRRLGAPAAEAERPGLGARIRRRLGIPFDETGANAALLAALERRQFDLLWVEKALALRAETLAVARRLQPWMRVAFFAEDDMALVHNRSRHFLEGLPHYDVVFATKTRNARPEELPALGARRVVAVAKSFDPELHRPLPVTAHDVRRLGGTVGFVGTYEDARGRALCALAAAGVSVRVWGNGWERLRQRRNMLLERRPLHGEDYVRAISATAVNLGFLRRQNRDVHSDRSVEIPACGGFLLAERTDEHLALFDEGVEAEFFEGEEELLAKVLRYRNDPGACQRVAAAGRARCFASGYSHDALLPRLLLAATSGEEAA